MNKVTNWRQQQQCRPYCTKHKLLFIQTRMLHSNHHALAPASIFHLQLSVNQWNKKSHEPMHQITFSVFIVLIETSRNPEISCSSCSSCCKICDSCWVHLGFVHIILFLSLFLFFSAWHCTNKFNRLTMTGHFHVYFFLKSYLIRQVSVRSHSPGNTTLKLLNIFAKCVVPFPNWSSCVCVCSSEQASRRTYFFLGTMTNAL